MKPTDTKTPSPSFDTWLQQTLQQEGPPEPADDGFSLRVMVALPEQVKQRRKGPAYSPAMRAAELAALALVAALLCSLPGLGLSLPELALALLSLLGLLMWWSLPQSRGSAWR